MGLQNREYMRSPYPAPGNDGHQMLFTLIIVNVISFFIFSGSGIALDLRSGFNWVNILQLFTSGFAHADFWHLFFNMWGLYIFGKLVTPYLSRYRFLLLFQMKLRRFYRLLERE